MSALDLGEGIFDINPDEEFGQAGTTANPSEDTPMASVSEQEAAVLPTLPQSINPLATVLTSSQAAAQVSKEPVKEFLTGNKIPKLPYCRGKTPAPPGPPNPPVPHQAPTGWVQNQQETAKRAPKAGPEEEKLPLPEFRPTSVDERVFNNNVEDAITSRQYHIMAAATHHVQQAAEAAQNAAKMATQLAEMQIQAEARGINTKIIQERILQEPDWVPMYGNFEAHNSHLRQRISHEMPRVPMHAPGADPSKAPKPKGSNQRSRKSKPSRRQRELAKANRKAEDQEFLIKEWEEFQAWKRRSSKK